MNRLWTNDEFWFYFMIGTIVVYFLLAVWYSLFLRYYNMIALTQSKHSVIYDQNNTPKRKDFNLLREHYNYTLKQYYVQNEEPPKEILKLRKFLMKMDRSKED